jgi:hypothetical protein
LEGAEGGKSGLVIGKYEAITVGKEAGKFDSFALYYYICRVVRKIISI